MTIKRLKHSADRDTARAQKRTQKRTQTRIANLVSRSWFFSVSSEAHR